MGWKIVVLDDFNGAAQLLSGNGGLWNASHLISPSKWLLLIQILIVMQFIKKRMD